MGSAFSESAIAAPQPPTRPLDRVRTDSPPRRSSLNLQKRLPGLLAVADFAGVAGTGFLIDTPFAWHDVRPLTHSLGIVWAATAVVNCFQVLQGYSPNCLPNMSSQFAKALFAWTFAFGSLIAFSLLTDRSQEFLGPWAAMWSLASLIYLVLARGMVVARFASWRKEGRLVRNVAVLGTGGPAWDVARRLGLHTEEANVVGVFIDGDRTTDLAKAAGNGDLLAEMATAGQVDEIIVALPWHSKTPLNRAIAKFAASQVEVRIEPGLPETDFPPQELKSIAGIATLTVQRRPLVGWGAPLKRIEDLSLAFMALIVAAPLLLLIALLVKMDSRGPVFFRQERYGFNNNRIMVLKFRSMHHERRPDPSVPQARRNDPRVTRIGAVLRRTSLDELPQLFNVVWGNMSLIGPRPHAAAHNQMYAELIDGYLGRHRMKPGITGWAQVNGLRGETETTAQMKRRLEYDLQYIANWSLLLDVKILLMTVPVVIRGTNAY